MPVLVAWLVGPATVDHPHPDHFVRPIDIPVALERVAGTLLGVATKGSRLSLRPPRRPRPDNICMDVQV
jgi:hypothetical protein